MLAAVLAALHGAAWLVLLSNLAYLRRRPSRAPAGAPRVSILVPARNEAANLRRLLPSLLEQDYPDFEVVLLDDGSEDETGAVARGFGDERLRVFRNEGPPAGWLGKNYALWRATREATGAVYLFLDADAELLGPGALGRLVAKWQPVEAASDGRGGVLTGLPRWAGGGLLLVSLVPFAQLTALPAALVPRTRNAHLSALNGQVWMIGAAAYHREEPHEALRDAVLEDVEIGRRLKARGLRLRLMDLRREVRVRMYESLGGAWRGFRKNVYLLQGGTPAAFLALHGAFVLVYGVGPAVSLGLLASAWGLKAATDLRMGFPWWLPLLAPLSLLLSFVLPVDSAVSHWTGRVRWKGRRVGT